MRVVVGVITGRRSCVQRPIRGRKGSEQGQLALASAIIQQKDILIQQQQSLIQQQLFSSEILIQSIHQDDQQEEDKEPLVGDIVAIKKYDWQFLELDLPTLLRRLKELFGKKRKHPKIGCISVLGVGMRPIGI